MSNIKRMKDKDGNYIYPVTHEDAVFDANGKTLGEKINDTIDKGLVEVMAAVNAIEASSPEIRYIAHRGYSAKAPENTIPAYIEAGKALYWGAEFDIQETSDGEFVLMHDDTVDRTTDGTGAIADMTLAQVKELIVDNGPNISLYPDLRVPTMEEVLICCKEYGMVPIIEVKTINNMDGFLNVIDSLGMIKQVVVISFNVSTLEAIRNANKDIRIQTLTVKSLQHCIDNNFDVDWYEGGLTKEKVEEYHRAGIKSNVWTVNDPERASELISWGVDYITTDKLNSERVGVMNSYEEITIINSKIELLIDQLILGTKGYCTLDMQFRPTQLGSGSSYAERYPVKDETANRLVTDRLIPTYNMEQLVVMSTMNNVKVAVHYYDANKIYLGDSGYIGAGSIFTPPVGTAYIVVYVALINNTATQSIIEEANELIKIYMGHDLKSKEIDFVKELLSEGVPAQYTYDISKDEDAMRYAIAGSTNTTALFPDVYPATTSGNKAIYSKLIYAADTKVQVSWDDSLAKVSIHPFTCTGNYLTDTGWGASGQIYDMNTYGGTYWAVITSTVSGNSWTQETFLQFLNSLVFTPVE